MHTRGVRKKNCEEDAYFLDVGTQNKIFETNIRFKKKTLSSQILI